MKDFLEETPVEHYLTIQKYLLMRRLFFTGLLLLICSLSKTYGQIEDQVQQDSSQQRSVVTGKVTNERSEPLPGVTIQIQGTGIGVITNDKGEYIITAPTPNSIMLVSSVGYKFDTIPVSGRSVVNISLVAANKGLQEIVVVGYGTQKKISVTGAVSELPVAQLEQVPTPSLSNAIGGKLPGVITRQSSGEPGYDQASVFIRGLGTFGAAQSPLVLVDGVERDMNNVNPEEIESFTILKDASATAVYGVRGANGVILIQTKRGKVGNPSVMLRSEAAQLTALRLPDYINGAEYAGLINEANEHVGLPPQYTPEDLQKYADGSDPYFHPDVNWTKAILKDHTYQTINNLNVSGGTNVVRYFTNVGYILQSGIYKQDGLNQYNTNANVKRYNFRTNIDINLTHSFSVSLGLGAIIQNGHYPGTPAPQIFSALGVISPIQYPITNPDGSVAGGASYLGRNPWGLVTQSGYSDQARHTLQSTFSAKWDLSKSITKGLSLNGKFAYDYYIMSGINRTIQYQIKQYTGKDPVTDEDLYNIVQEGGPMGYAPFTSDNHRLSYFEGTVNYQRSFGQHDVSGMLMMNQRQYTNLVAGNSILGLPYRSRGYAGRATYAYANRYLVEFDFGDNGSENFPRGKRFGFFPAVSAGWIISNEKFWNVDFINLLKIRGSWGKVGNDQIGQRFLYLSYYNKNTNTYWFGNSQQAYSGYDEGQIGDENVTWETATKKNIGLDMNMWDNKIELQVNAFSELRTGILMQRQTIPFVTGFFPWILPYANLGEVKNSGMDASLKVQNKAGRDQVYYSAMATFTYAHNTVLENDEAPPLFPYQSGKGHPIGAPYGLVAIGIFKDQAEIDQSPVQSFSSVVYPGDIKYKDVNGDGVINSYDYTYLKGYPRTPEITYGFGGTVAYKGFDASLYFSGAARTSIFTVGPSIFPFERGPMSYNVLREYYDNRWLPDHTDARYPAVTPDFNSNNFQNSSLYLRNAAFLRLKNAEIGYTFPDGLIKRWKLNSIRVFVNGTNLLTFDGLKFLDPESNSGATNGDLANLGLYPLQRALNAGFQINF